MRQGYLDSVDLRIIDEIARELRSRNDDEVSFEARRRRIFALYLQGLQTLGEISTELARQPVHDIEIPGDAEAL